MSVGLRCPDGFQKSARAEAASRSGGSDQFTDAGRWPVTEQMAAANHFGIPRDRGSEGGCSSPGGDAISTSRARRYRESRHGDAAVQYRTPMDALECAGDKRVLLGSRGCGSSRQSELSGSVRGRLQRWRGHYWLRGGRLHVSRSGSKWTTREDAAMDSRTTT